MQTYSAFLSCRMRPEISRLLVPTIYSDLQDHSSVLCYPKVEGVKVSMFFLKHEEPEDTPDESRSKRNTYEAQFLASLYRYLRLQGYSEKDITVLALYKDQVLLLRSLIKQVKCCWLSSLSRCLSLSLSLSRSLSLFLALALSLSLSLFFSLSLLLPFSLSFAVLLLG